MLWILALFGCPWVSGGQYQTQVQDADGDGGIAERFGGTDCVDADATIADCDADGDGVRAQAAGGDDCDDNDPSVYPGATEVCSGRDEDCDGLIDDQDEDVAGQLMSWLDADGDGVGGPVQLESCDRPVGYAPVSGDCNDADPMINPNAAESCDEIDHNCDGLVRAGATNTITWYLDADGDGLGGAVSGVSCEPPNPDDTSTGGDCDDADPSATLPRVFYIDSDGDGRGLSAVSVQACSMPPHHAVLGDDCDDNNPARYPQALEVCDGIDNDCDQLVDDADNDVFSPGTWFADADGDGFTVPFDSVRSCVPLAHYIPGSLVEDCDDTDAGINPGQPERCDDPAVDDDCDGLINEADPDYIGLSYWLDNDLDGYGSGAPVTACLQPFGYTIRDGDCDDSNALVNPDSIWYADDDLDGFGRSDTQTVACNPPGDWALEPTDCDDTAPNVNPAQAEVCGVPGVDENCNGASDAGDGTLINGQLFGVDADGDGSPANTETVLACIADSVTGYLPLLPGAPLDCDDDDPGVYPGGPELHYDGVDANCDPTDEYDADGDGFACTQAQDAACPLPVGDPNGDCDDGDPGVNPSAEEIWYDTIDQNCDGNRYDADGDGFAARLPDGYPAYQRDDADRDGLFDVLEHGAHCAPGVEDLHGYPCTDPTLADTDGGGVPDGLEILQNTDPRDPSDDQLTDDNDRDGLTDVYEHTLGTDPLDPDTDGDGVPDAQELELGTDPLSPDLDCNDVDPLRYPQVFTFDGLSFVRTGLHPPAGCDTHGLAGLQALVDCNCANTLNAPTGSIPTAVELAGGTLDILGTGSPLLEASLSDGTFGSCTDSTSVSCITRAEEDGLNDPMFTVSDAPDPTFPGERREGLLTLQRVVLLSGRSLRGGAVWVQAGGGAVVEQSVFTRNLAYTAGGAIAVDDDGFLVSKQNAFFFNVSVGQGGAIATDGGALQIRDNQFLANQGTQSGAIDAQRAAALQILDTEFVINASPQVVITPGPGVTTIERTGFRGLPGVVTGVGDALGPPSDLAMMEVLAGDGLVRIEDSRFLGAERYLDVFSPVDVRRSVFWGTLVDGPFSPVMLAEGTSADFRRNVIDANSGPLGFDGAVGTVSRNLFWSNGNDPAVLSDGAGSLFGPVLADNGFAGTNNLVIWGRPIYPRSLSAPALNCDDGPTRAGACITHTGSVLLGPEPPLYRFHLDLDRSLWDLHLRPIGGFPSCGAIGSLPPDLGPQPDQMYSRDMDMDGWPDGWAQAVGVVGSCTDDPDGDHLNNLLELQLGGLPNTADTDGDGVNDGDEYMGRTDLLDPDTDDDGLNDGAEMALGTDPTIPDTDGDGVLDGADPAPLDPNTP